MEFKKGQTYIAIKDYKFWESELKKDTIITILEKSKYSELVYKTISNSGKEEYYHIKWIKELFKKYNNVQINCEEDYYRWLAMRNK